MKRLLAAGGAVLALAACNDGTSRSGRALSPIPPATMALMASKGMEKTDPILVRLYKKESELEVWKRKDGQYALLKTFPICRWSGQLGPKTREGDRQAPEGFYAITPGQMNPNSSFYLSFDTGYPNAFDRSHGRTGSHLMVHGDCSSRGCYAMTDEGISEVYALAREAFGAGQRNFQVQAYPFRMTSENLAKYRHDPNMPFWKNLKQGSDHFEITKREPKVSVCSGRYAFNTIGNDCTSDPTLSPAVARKDEADRQEVADLVQKGTPAVRLVYADGGGHESFRAAAAPTVVADAGSSFALLDARPARKLGTVSRPDALAEGPSEIAMAEPVRPAGKAKGSTAVAALAVAARRPAEPGPAAAAPAKAEPAAAGAAKPFYERMMAEAFGKAPTDAAAEPAAVAEAAPAPAPARAKTAVARPAHAAASAAPAQAAPAASSPPSRPKPQASLDKRRHADAARFLPGAASLGPSPTTFSR